MTAHVQNAPAFVEQIHAVCHFLTQHIHAPFEAERGKFLSRAEIMLDFFEYPRASEAGTADHHGIYAITVEAFLAALRRGDVAIADRKSTRLNSSHANIS